MAQLDQGVLGHQTERGRLEIVLERLGAHLNRNACLFRVLGAQAEHLGDEAGYELVDAVDEGVGGILCRSLLGKPRVRLRYELNALQVIDTLLPIRCLVVRQRLRYPAYLAI